MAEPEREWRHTDERAVVKRQFPMLRRAANCMPSIREVTWLRIVNILGVDRMSSRTSRAVGAAISGIALIAGTVGCAGGKIPESTVSTTVPADQSTPAAIAKSIQSFFGAATSDKIGEAFPDRATDETFKPVLEKMDLSVPTSLTKKTITDLALLKVSDPKAPLALSIDDSKVQIDGTNASIPASALSVTSRGKRVSNNDVLASDMNHLTFRNGEWIMTFPATPSPTASAPTK